MRDYTLVRIMYKAPVVALALFLSNPSFGGDGPTEPAYLYKATVTRVVDGDTIEVDIDLGFYTWLHSQRIRMVKINAPEVRGANKAAGLTVSAYLTDMVLGKEIILQTLKRRDGAIARASTAGGWGEFTSTGRISTSI